MENILGSNLERKSDILLVIYFGNKSESWLLTQGMRWQFETKTNERFICGVLDGFDDKIIDGIRSLYKLWRTRKYKLELNFLLE